MTQTLGDRMKAYEAIESGRVLLPNAPVCVRLDGRAFHTWTHGLERPFSDRLRDAFTATTIALVHETNALVGYTQSDEITLVLGDTNPASRAQPYFGNRAQKIVSLTASVATAAFARATSGPEWADRKAKAPALFDSRAWSVPNWTEAANVLLWRELDATKNSINQAAQAKFSHKALHGLDGKQLQEKLFREAGINWNDYPARHKRGVYVLRRHVKTPFTPTEIGALPPLHAARKNPGLLVERSVVEVVELPPLPRLANREQVLFFGAVPLFGTVSKEPT